MEQSNLYLPTTREEAENLGWQKFDVILVSGDTYIDSPFIGAAVIGRVLAKAGHRVGIIAQPDVNSGDIARLGEPLLFWGVTGGSVDSMVANYTPTGKKRKSDDFTPGGRNTRRPDRAVIAYTNLIKKHFKNTRPIVLGGIEASLRRIAHYDFWSNGVRRSILADAKADFLLYGMAEKSVLQLAAAISNNENPEHIRGLCYLSRTPPKDALELPSYQAVSLDKKDFARMFHLFYRNNDGITAKTIFQQQDTRYLIQTPPQPPLSTAELDEIHALGFTRKVHPFYRRQGKVAALDTIQFSILSHRGCYGECNYCAIAVHQGRTVQSRSQESILAEAQSFSGDPDFKKIILDVGGPTANMYGYECRKKMSKGACSTKRCIFPEICSKLEVNHEPLLSLLKKLRSLPAIKKIFIASGVRYDLALGDKKSGYQYLAELVSHHVSGQLKVAPEHSNRRVLDLMGKPAIDSLLEFKNQFERLTGKAGKKQYLTYYFIAAHPGCSEADMQETKRFAGRRLKISPEQVQIFTPTPSTYSTLMYYTGIDPFTGKELFVERSVKGREKQKSCLTGYGKKEKRRKYK